MVGTVYIIVFNYNLIRVPDLNTGDVEIAAMAGPTGGIVATAVIPITAGNINTILQTVFNVVNANTFHTIYIVATGQAAPVRLTTTTLPCPDIYFLNALQQTVKCVNKGATAIFNISVDPDPTISGILKGTVWVIDWGDGNISNYTSTADGDYPPLAMRTHTYSNVTSCNYVFTCGVKNPCGKTFSPQYVAIVHGRDQATDGDGVLQIVNNADGTTAINVCAGTQSTITLRDNSTWNCQNPTVSGGLTAVPNNSTRNIEWQYGQDPTGVAFNTITGTVTIATLGPAPEASGRILPAPYGATSLSQAITIPATCQAGQYFRVYLEYWNQECNWNDPEYIDTYIDIKVIAAPAAPTAPDRTICLGDVTTLNVTSTPVGTITWYANAGLTTVLGTGTSYTPTITTAGITYYYVTDQSTTGLMCMSPATKVTLTTRETLSQPGAITGPAQVCSSQTGVTFSVAANPPDNAGRRSYAICMDSTGRMDNYSRPGNQDNNRHCRHNSRRPDS